MFSPLKNRAFLGAVPSRFVFYSTSPSAKSQIGDKAAEMDVIRLDRCRSCVDREGRDRWQRAAPFAPKVLREEVDSIHGVCRSGWGGFLHQSVFVTEGSNFRDALSYFDQIDAIFKWMESKEIAFPPIWSILDPWMDEDVL